MTNDEIKDIVYEWTKYMGWGTFLKPEELDLLFEEFWKEYVEKSIL